METATRGYNRSTRQQPPAPPVYLLDLTCLCHLVVLGSPITSLSLNLLVFKIGVLPIYEVIARS